MVKLLLVIPFLIKLPAYGLHLWLPLAHVESPTVGRIVLAAVILKLGSCGLMHIVVAVGTGLVTVLAIVGAVIGPLITVFQSDVKCLVAYSSVAHMSLLTIGL